MNYMHNNLMSLNWNNIRLPQEAEGNLIKLFDAKLMALKALDSDDFSSEEIEAFLSATIKDTISCSFAPDLADMFSRWRDGNFIPLPFLLPLIEKQFEIEEEHPLIDALLAACVLAEIEHDNCYHHNHHFREVFVITVLLCARHNACFGNDNDALNQDDIMLLLIATAIHDLSHDGGDMIENKQLPSRLEKLALRHAKPFLQANGVVDEEIDIIQLIIICTDVIRDHHGISPAMIAQSAYHYHYRGQGEVVAINELYMPLINNSKVAFLARLLGEADVIPSSGLDYKFSINQTKQICLENDELRPAAATLYAFMDVVCQGGYDTKAAQDLFGNHFKAILKKVRNDTANSVLYS